MFGLSLKLEFVKIEDLDLSLGQISQNKLENETELFFGHLWKLERCLKSNMVRVAEW